MIDHDNLKEYADPGIYDLENADFEPDGPFFLTLARQVGGAVLELGCGTGRITIPLAQSGIDITGLDLVPGMLARARDKARHLAIRWIEADVRTFHLETQFRLIFATGATFEHLLERADQEAMLTRVREHLAPGGRFVFGAIFPRPALMANAEMHDWFTYSDEHGQQVHVAGTQHYDHLRQIRTETAYRRWRDAEGRKIIKRAPLVLRLTFPQEMDALLHYNGLIIVRRYGDWDSSPLTDESRVMIYVCRKAE